MKKLSYAILQTIMAICMLICISCNAINEESTPTPPVEESSLPTPRSTLLELMQDMQSEDVAVRLVSIYALEAYGNDAAPAIPYLIKNLYYVEDFDVRKAAAYILGKLGPTAKASVPDLIRVLQNDNYYHAKVAAAEALCNIGDRSAVPTLSETIFKKDSEFFNLTITCAVAISKIAGEEFRGSDSGICEISAIYDTDQNGVPLIIIDARNWWQEKGQFQDW